MLVAERSSPLPPSNQGHGNYSPSKNNTTTLKKKLSDKDNSIGRKLGSRRDHRKTHPEESCSGSATTKAMSNTKSRYPNLSIDTNPHHETGHHHDVHTPATSASADSYSNTSPTNEEKSSLSYSTQGLRGGKDIRSPGAKQTPAHIVQQAAAKYDESAPIPDFITQTDKYGNATTPRPSPSAKGGSPRYHSGRSNKIANSGNDDDNNNNKKSYSSALDDPCDAILESLRSMCCCISPDEKSSSSSMPTHGKRSKKKDGKQRRRRNTLSPLRKEQRESIKLLPKIHPNDVGKKCLVLDLDETLVHSSFRAVPGADFVIPVQIEDVVHFVYVAKRPGVDEFLLEMSKYYEIVVYTASLNKYADPLLDLLDPHRVIRTRLFRESCVYYEGNYVKDLSLLDRDLKHSIIVDNSPNSYLFQPENAIDCSSFIDDPNDRELPQIAGFLKDIEDVEDVTGICRLWKKWPDVDLSHIKRQTTR